MTRKRILNPGERKGPGMSAGVVAGGMIYLAGQVAIDENGALVGEGDVVVQAEQCLRNIERILAPVGATLADIVELTCYLSAAEHAREYLGVRARVFAEDPPATTTVIAPLLDPRFLVELKAVALLPAGAS